LLEFFKIVFKTKWRYAYLPESGAERQKGRRQRRIAPFILTAGIDLKKRHVDMNLPECHADDNMLYR